MLQKAVLLYTVLHFTGARNLPFDGCMWCRFHVATQTAITIKAMR